MEAKGKLRAGSMNSPMVAPATPSKPRADLPRPAWIRWLPFWHSLAYLLTIGVAIFALLHVQAWQTGSLIGLGILLWLGWYSACVCTEPWWWGRHPLLAGAYLVVGWGLWIGLSRLDATCSILSFVLYTQVFLFVALPWKVFLAVALAVLNLGLDVSLNGGWNPVLLGVVAINLMCIVIAVFVSSLIRQSYVQRQLIRELAEERQKLAAEERKAGMIEERQRLAYDIHDTLAQGFTSIVMHLEAADAAFPNDVRIAQQHLDQARRTARENLVEARRLMWALQPEAQGRAPLGEVLSALTDHWMHESSLEIVTTVTGNLCPLRPEYEHTLLRAAQEALTNVRKHAHASQVVVTLSYMDDMVTLDVQDDGVGFVWEEAQRASEALGQASGFGLKSLRERVEKLGGTLIIESTPGEGTTIAIALPAFLGGSEERE